MKAGLLERIKGVGHWRINFKPLSLPPEPLRLGQCREIVEKASVSIRGWDFPHISRRTDNEGGYENAGEYVENWTDWYGFHEFWRMYRSTQFLSYVALREDTKSDEFGSPQIPVLNVTGTVYQLTEILEFFHRLLANGLYASGVILEVSLVNTVGRTLVAGQGRMPFFDSKQTTASRLDLTKRLGIDAASEDHRAIAIDFCLDLFDRFGWNPDRTQLEAEQENFYRQGWR